MTGPERFIKDLEAMGFVCEARGPLVLVNLDIGPPDHPGLRQVGTDPPGDFPNTPPHWLHLPQEVVLPPGREGGQASELGPAWLKWSRKHPKWPPGGDVCTWLAHTRSLVLTAN